MSDSIHEIPLGWNEGDNVILCRAWRTGACLGLRVECELCRAAICANPLSVRKVKTTPGWHLICHPCQNRLGPCKLGGPRLYPGQPPPDWVK